jgi:hypothetical protein
MSLWIALLACGQEKLEEEDSGVQEEAQDTGDGEQEPGEGSVEDSGGDTEPPSEDTAEAGEDTGSGDGEDTASGDQGPLAIVGSYFDQDNNEHVIGESHWTMDYGANDEYSYSITQYSNASGWLVAENGENDALETGKWSRFDWVRNRAGTVWYCQTAYTAATEQEALDTQAADSTDPTSGSGCPGYGWFELRPW